MSRKKRILFNSNHSKAFTGFGKNTKNLLKYLHSTGKFDICEYAAGMVEGHPDLQTLPWEAKGTLPNDQFQINELNKDQFKARNASYGELRAETAVKEFKPDLVIHAEDFWAVSWSKDKNYFKKVPTLVWVTHDSLPLIGLNDTNSFPHYWVWSDFARKEFHRHGYNHVKTQYPPINLDHFYNLGDTKKKEVRKKFNIPEDVFVIGDTFRNQLRKLIPNTIEGYSIFKKDNPGAKSILLFVTNFSEGWNIPDLAKQYGVDMKEIWTAYVSNECNEYFLHPFIGQDLKCPFTGKEKACHTVNVVKGVSEEQLNEIYNVMDVFLHPASSGACEIPCVESAAAEKIVLTADYSYGEDIIELNKGALCLDWAKYTEIGTQFIKSSPFPSSIAKQLKKVYNMDPSKRAEMGKLSRQWAKENYDLELNCKKIEEFIDSLPLIDWDTIDLNPPKANPSYELPTNSRDLPNDEFVKLLYRNILNREPDEGGFNTWMTQLNNKVPREEIVGYFRKVANEEVQKNTKTDIWDIIDKDRPNSRLLFVVKESAGDTYICTALLEGIKENYPNHDIYWMGEQKYHEILEGCPLIHKILPYIPQLDNEMAAIGCGQEKGLFDVYLCPTVLTQHKLSYLSNNNPKLI